MEERGTTEGEKPFQPKAAGCLKAGMLVMLLAAGLFFGWMFLMLTLVLINRH